ncbi:MAG TPA: hypothetical protein VGI81_16070 [Tepidisphaeraceae bacterium]|jgi:hypothetical protein
MMRRLFIAASVVSLMLCAAAIGLDRRSERLKDAVGWDAARNRRSVGVISASHRIQLIYFPITPACGWAPQFVHDVQPLDRHWSLIPVSRPMADIQALGFHYQAGRFIGLPIYQLTASTRSLALAFAILPAIAAAAFTGRRLRARRRRRVRGLCHVCSYDLRASKDRCPECGTPITSNTKAEA